jgi:mono/diheme cytochrome c family protein
MKSSGRRLFASSLGVGLALVLTTAALADEQQGLTKADGDRGQELYQMYCSSCHGKRAFGDGPAAKSHDAPPTNLTLLSKRNDGKFPSKRVHQTIDGRLEVRAHGERHMPIWGLAFQEYDRDTNQEAEVQFRIRWLVDYLESIQK